MHSISVKTLAEKKISVFFCKISEESPQKICRSVELRKIYRITKKLFETSGLVKFMYF